MLVYKIKLEKSGKSEIVYQAISSKVKLPTQEMFIEYADSILTINTCDSSMLTDEESKLYQLDKKQKG